jgi:RNA polymerase sigma-70 factor (ECF subfamily)
MNVAVFSDYRRSLRHYLSLHRRWFGEDVDDLEQEVYLRLHRYPPREELREPLAYLYEIAKQVLADRLRWWRGQRRDREASWSEEAQDALECLRDEFDPERIVAGREELWRQLRRCGPAAREALALTGLGYTSYEIAWRLRVSSMTALTYRARGRIRLRNVA